LTSLNDRFLILIINQKYYKIMKVCVTILILIMLLIGMKRVCAQEHRHKIDSVNNIVLLTGLFWTARTWGTANR